MPTDYDALAGRYDEDRARWSFPPDEIIDELVKAHAVLRVLDLGCGTGRWLAAQRDPLLSGVTLLGVDPSSAMLAEARAKGIRSVVRAQAEDLPFGRGTIGYVACSYAFHHFTDKERALDEVARVLSADGVVRIDNIEPTAAGGWWLYEFFPETVALDASRFWPPERLADALEARGFTVEVQLLDAGVDQVPAHVALADAERRVASQLASLDDDAYGRGLARLRRAAAGGDATVTTSNARIRATARRLSGTAPSSGRGPGGGRGAG